MDDGDAEPFAVEEMMALIDDMNASLATKVFCSCFCCVWVWVWVQLFFLIINKSKFETSHGHKPDPRKHPKDPILNASYPKQHISSGDAATSSSMHQK